MTRASRCRSSCSALLLVCLLLTVVCRAATAQTEVADNAQRFDVVLQQGLIHRGDGSPGTPGTVAVRQGKLTLLPADAVVEADQTIDCRGLMIAPGFIDLHTHSDEPLLDRNTRASVNYLMQGCTTMVTGNCGFGPVDTGGFLQQIDQSGAGTNVAHLIPHGSLRSEVMGKVNRAATAEELQQMLQLADKAMQDGAWGMSTGLIYIPGTFTPTSELTSIAGVVAKHAGIYASHIRGEGTELLQSIEEALQIGQGAGCRVHVSHFKASGRPSWGTLRLAISRIEKARAEGQQVTADQYPYTASSTSLEATLLPAWAREGGREALAQRLQDPGQAQQIRGDVQQKLETATRIQLASCNHNRSWIGKSLDEVAQAEGREVCDIVLEIEQNGGASVVNFNMSEEDLRLAMPRDWVATASDGGSKIPTGSQPHPRSFGTFPRKIGRYAIAENVLSLEAAIRSATGLPADILGISDRGRLLDGLAADVVVFSPEEFRDRADFDNPYQAPAGLRYVLVNGVFAVFDGQPTGALAGRSLRKVAVPAK